MLHTSKLAAPSLRATMKASRSGRLSWVTIVVPPKYETFWYEHTTTASKPRTSMRRCSFSIFVPVELGSRVLIIACAPPEVFAATIATALCCRKTEAACAAIALESRHRDSAEGDLHADVLGDRHVAREPSCGGVHRGHAARLVDGQIRRCSSARPVPKKHFPKVHDAVE